MKQLLALLLLLTMLATGAEAHTRSQSYSGWTLGERSLDGVFTVDAYRATQLTEVPQDLPALVAEHLYRTVHATQDRVTCLLAPPKPLMARSGQVKVEIHLQCPFPLAQVPAELTVGAFFDVSLSHVHYMRIRDVQGNSHETVLTSSQTSVMVTDKGIESATGFLDFIHLGAAHVLSGMDHIAFLAALALLASSLRGVVLAITGFTIGHSLTLSLVVLNVLQPNSAPIEALIGFTAAWAAGEALRCHRHTSRWFGLLCAGFVLLLPLLAWVLQLPMLNTAVIVGAALFAACTAFLPPLHSPVIAPAIATVFGLVHGAGFAGPLLEMRIPTGHLLVPILGFNVGVELGQLLALAVMAAGAWVVVRRFGSYRTLAFDITASAIFALGTFWFVSRAFG